MKSGNRPRKRSVGLVSRTNGTIGNKRSHEVRNSPQDSHLGYFTICRKYGEMYCAYVATQASLIGNGSNATQLSRKTSPQISANVCPATLKISLILHLWFSQSLNEYQSVMRKSETQKCRSPFHVFVCQHTKCQSRYKHYKVMFFKMLN